MRICSCFIAIQLTLEKELLMIRIRPCGEIKAQRKNSVRFWIHKHIAWHHERHLKD
jgi:hypothetical protein